MIILSFDRLIFLIVVYTLMVIALIAFLMVQNHYTSVFSLDFCQVYDPNILSFHSSLVKDEIFIIFSEQ